MIKTGDVKTYVTRCDFCSKTAIDIDDDGVARCEEHQLDKSSKAVVKSAAEKMSKKHLDREE